MVHRKWSPSNRVKSFLRRKKSPVSLESASIICTVLPGANIWARLYVPPQPPENKRNTGNLPIQISAFLLVSFPAVDTELLFLELAAAAASH